MEKNHELRLAFAILHTLPLPALATLLAATTLPCEFNRFKVFIVGNFGAGLIDALHSIGATLQAKGEGLSLAVANLTDSIARSFPSKGTSTVHLALANIQGNVRVRT
jgi:hypothetical protein